MPGPLPFQLPFADEVLGAMITPAVLISACGTLTLSTTNRLGRIVDRVRTIGHEAEAMNPEANTFAEYEEKRDLVNSQLECLVRRIRLLQSALTVLYISIVLLVSSSLSIGLKSATRILPEGVPVILGLAGATALLTASVFLVTEARVAVNSTLREMAYIRKLVAQKTGVPPAS